MDEMTMQTRRDFVLRASLIGAGLALLGRKGLALVTGPRPAVTGPAPIPMAVYSDPNCGCCSKWVSLMDAAGFQTSVQHTTDMASIKKRYAAG